MKDKAHRTEHDSMGELQVPQSALWAAQTQRAVNNFQISGLTMPRAFIRALGLIKYSAAGANGELGLMKAATVQAIQAAALAVAEGQYDEHFPVDVFQTGSGTSSNMNANEVIARLATSATGQPVHPNDDVNMGQSSNDVIPTAVHVSAAIEINEKLLPALKQLHTAIINKAETMDDIVKTGRTHLMDAMPVTLGQELRGWASQVQHGSERIASSMPRLLGLAQGATAVGTGINAHPDFGANVATILSEQTGLHFTPADNCFEALASQDASVEMSGQLRTLAVSLMKIANDLRWMNSGPLAGLGEITLPALQPGSSIMPGKVNPVIPEAVAMLSVQVMGNDATIAIAGQAGNFQLNVMLPVVAYNLLQSIEVLASGSVALAKDAISDFRVNEDNLTGALSRNPILVTALNAVIGYDKGAAIAKRAYAEGRPVREVAKEETDLTDEELDRLLDPGELTKGGIKT